MPAEPPARCRPWVQSQRTSAGFRSPRRPRSNHARPAAAPSGGRRCRLQRVEDRLGRPHLAGAAPDVDDAIDDRRRGTRASARQVDDAVDYGGEEEANQRSVSKRQRSSPVATSKARRVPGPRSRRPRHRRDHRPPPGRWRRSRAPLRARPPALVPRRGVERVEGGLAVVQVDRDDVGDAVQDGRTSYVALAGLLQLDAPPHRGELVGRDRDAPVRAGLPPHRHAGRRGGRRADVERSGNAVLWLRPEGEPDRGEGEDQQRGGELGQRPAAALETGRWAAGRARRGAARPSSAGRALGVSGRRPRD